MADEISTGELIDIEGFPDVVDWRTFKIGMKLLEIGYSWAVYDLKPVGFKVKNLGDLTLASSSTPLSLSPNQPLQRHLAPPLAAYPRL